MLKQYAPADAVYYMSICGDWDREKYQILKSQNLNVEILWERTGEEKGITGTRLRALIAENGEWRQALPGALRDDK